MSDTPLRVAIISHSDVLGGAGMVSYRLTQALRNHGIDARMVVYTKLSDDPMVSLVSHRTSRGLRFMLERLRIFLANGFQRSNLFKVSIANIGSRVDRHPWVRDADIILLGWTNQGLLSLKGLQRLGKLGKPLVWILHDMWALTGICHHAYECTAYHEGCGNCMFLTGNKQNDLSAKVFRQKQAVYDSLPDITFVPVSRWLAGRCSSSPLLRGRRIEVIPNPFPVDFFNPDALDWGSDLPLPADRPNRIVMCAARLDDPIKGLPYAVEALNHIFDNRPDIAKTLTVLFIGEIRDRSILDNLRINYHCVGRINDPKLLRQIYASSQVVLSTSLYETLPGTLIEGQATGCIPVSFGRGGQEDFIKHKETGYIAEYKNPQSVADGIIWALENPIDRHKLHSNVVGLFASAGIAERYIDLFHRLLGSRS